MHLEIGNILPHLQVQANANWELVSDSIFLFKYFPEFESHKTSTDAKNHALKVHLAIIFICFRRCWYWSSFNAMPLPPCLFSLEVSRSFSAPSQAMLIHIWYKAFSLLVYSISPSYTCELFITGGQSIGLLSTRLLVLPRVTAPPLHLSSFSEYSDRIPRDIDDVWGISWGTADFCQIVTLKMSGRRMMTQWVWILLTKASAIGGNGVF